MLLQVVTMLHLHALYPGTEACFVGENQKAVSLLPRVASYLTHPAKRWVITENTHALLARQQFCDDSQRLRTALGDRYAIPDYFKKEKQPRPDVTQCTVTVAYFSLIQGALWASDEL